MFGSNRTAFGGGSQPFGSTASPFASQPQPQAGTTFGMGVTNNNAQSGFGGFGAANNAGAGSGGPTGSLFGMSTNNTTQNSPFVNPTGAATTANLNNSGSNVSSTNSSMGTSIKPFQPYEEKDPTTGVQNVFQTISAMPEYRNFSQEELRLQDYQQGRRFGQGTVTPFGNTSTTNNTNQGFGILGNTNQPQSAGSGAGGLFGQRTNTAQNSPFGSLSSGNNATTTGTGPFGSTTAAGGNAFGGSGTGPFGSKPAGTTGAPGGGLFGQNNRTSSGGLFGQSNNAFGQPQTSAFGAGAGNSAFGSKPAGGGLFGQPQNNAPFGGAGTGANAGGGGGGLFGQSNNQPPTGGGLFGQNTSTPFGQPQQGNTGTGLFGNKPAGGGLFGQPQNNAPFGGGGSGGGGLFGQNSNQSSTGGGLFGQNNNQPSSGGGLFGQSTSQPPAGGGLFGNTQNQPPAGGGGGGGLFGQSNNQPPTGGGLFGQNTSTPFGQPQQGNTGTGLFGNKPAGGGLFGQPQNNTPFGGGGGGGLFGQSNNQPPAGGGLFGQSTSQPPAGGGLFGNTQNQPPAGGGGGGGLFGQSNNQPPTGGGGLFGQNNNQPSTGGGLFGAKPIGGGGGGLFGQSNNPQPPAGGGLFGQSTSQPPAGGGLFGNTQNQPPASGGLFGNKPAGATGGGLFGNTAANNQSTLGQPSGGGLFGSKPASAGGATSSTGGGIFGNTSNASQPGGGGFGATGGGGGGGLFGNTSNTSQPSAGGGLFGNKPAGSTGGGLFGNTNNNPQSNAPGAGTTGVGSGGGLFGNKPAGTTSGIGGFGSGGGLFGNNNNTSNNALGGGATQGNAGTAGAGLGGGLFGNKPQQPAAQPSGFPPQQQVNQDQINNPYGTNELFSRVVVPSSITQPTKPSATKVNADIKKKASLTGAYRLAPRPLFTSKSLSGNATPKFDSFSGSSTRSSSGSSSPDSIGKELVPTSTGSTLFSPESDEAILSADKLLFNPDKKSFKNLVINKRKAEQDQLQDDVEIKKITLQSDTNGDSKSTNKNLNESTAFGEVLDSPTVGKEFSSKDLGMNRDRLSVSPARNQSSESEESVSDKNVKTRGIIAEDVSFTDNGYYISPSLETLSTKSLPQLRRVSGLVVGHKDYGKIEFVEPVDLSNVPLALLCGNIIVFEPKSCFVYPYSSTVPEPGEGINVRARISCYKCYPADKATRAPIKDANHQLVKRHIEKLKKLPHTKFDSYDPVTGCYRFVVEHPVTS